MKKSISCPSFQQKNPLCSDWGENTVLPEVHSTWKMKKPFCSPCLRKSVSTNAVPALFLTEAMPAFEQRLEYQATFKTTFHQLEACQLEHLNIYLDSTLSSADIANLDPATQEQIKDFASCLACPPECDETSDVKTLRRNLFANIDQNRLYELISKIRRNRKKSSKDQQ